MWRKRERDSSCINVLVEISDRRWVLAKILGCWVSPCNRAMCMQCYTCTDQPLVQLYMQSYVIRLDVWYDTYMQSYVLSYLLYVYAIIPLIRIYTGWESHCMWLCMVCHVKYVQTTTTPTSAIVISMIRIIRMIRICNQYWSCICAIVCATQCHVKYAQTTATCAIVCKHTGVPGIACDDCDNDVDDNYDNDDDVMTTT